MPFPVFMGNVTLTGGVAPARAVQVKHDRRGRGRGVVLLAFGGRV